MKTYAQIENNTVINTVVAYPEWIALQSGEWIEFDETNPCSIGWAVNNGVCVLPEPELFPVIIESEL